MSRVKAKQKAPAQPTVIVKRQGLDMNDKCPNPNCGATLRKIAEDMMDDPKAQPEDGMKVFLPTVGIQFVLVCTRCGTVFVPASFVPLIMERSKPKSIITPGMEKGSLLLPGGPK